MLEDKKISIIIPSYKCEKYLEKLLISIQNQTKQPFEIIIIDSKSDLVAIQKITKLYDHLNIVIKQIKSSSFPGNKRNLGAKISNGEILAFLDLKTLPKKDWLENGLNLLLKKNYSVVFGSTKFKYKTYLQKLINNATFGDSIHETTPGTILYKETFLGIGYFLENVRAGDDLEWRERIKKNKVKNIFSEKEELNYFDDNKNIYSFLKKIFVYSLHSSFVSVQTNIKYFYLILLLLFSMIIVPKWNYIIPDWKNNMFYVPNITKIYVLSLLFIYVLYFSINFIFKLSNNKFKDNFFNDLFTYIILIIIFCTAYFWNRTIADGIDYGVWYIPHVTKIYVSSVVIISLLYRGLFNPLNKKIKLKNLFPFNWLFVGLIGLCIDIVKAPGYLIGALFLPFVKK